jgi:hypothetical protein
MSEDRTQEFGKAIAHETLRKGMLELCPDLQFDIAGAHGLIHPYIAERVGVFYNGIHICAMDRGMVPEFKIWTVKKALVPISLSEAHAKCLPIQFMEILPGSEYYDMGKEKAHKGDDAWNYDPEKNRLLRYQAFEWREAVDRIERVGWRHTFERLIAARIDGITRESIGKKFGVDMNVYPTGSPEDINLAIVME